MIKKEKLILLNEKETAELLNVSPGTLSVWRSTKKYPLNYVKIGRSVRYRLFDILDFIKFKAIKIINKRGGKNDRINL